METKMTIAEAKVEERAAMIEAQRNDLVRLRAENARLRKALAELLPVAEETCKRWPNDDCFLVPTAAARAALAERT